MLEMDVQATLDGEIVVIHDETVDRTTDGSGRVSDLTLAELQELDAAHHFQDPQGRHSFRGTGVTVPRFEDVLLALPDVRMNVEAKDGRSAPGLVEIILRHRAEERVLVAAEWEKNRHSVVGYPGPWGASRRDLIQLLLSIYTPWGRSRVPNCDALQIPEKYRGIPLLTRRLIAEAHSRNLPIHVWTVDDPADMRRLLALGVDGIQTDRPDILAPILSELFDRPPAPAMGSGP
jgi:glycerophosphoryl diester phosphodiesterase